MRVSRSTATPARAVCVAVATLMFAGAGSAADIDIYAAAGGATAPNVVFLLDNTSNWSSNKQAWSKASVDSKCNALANATQKSVCLGYSTQIFSGKSSLTQGEVQLRALKLVLNELVCSGASSALKVNIGLSLMGQQSVASNGHGVGLINFAVQPLAGTASTSGSSCRAIIQTLDTMDASIQNPEYKAPSSANYGAAYYEIFKYFGGHTNPTLAGKPSPNGGSPVGATGYGTTRYSKPNVLDDVNAFTSAARTTYRSPLSAASSCGNNYIVLVGNAYPNAEPNNGGPTLFQGIDYTPPALSAVTSDTNRLADEWSYFLANTDVSDLPGVQRVFTYAVNTYNDKPDSDQTKLMKSMAAVGGIGPSAYLEVGGDLYRLVEGFKDILSNIAAVNSVFTATTLPVSTTTQGTFLNQIFVGMFRPDANFSPRWVGNLKQYQLGYVNGVLDLVDKNGKSAVLGGTGFFNATAESFWTEDSVFFAQSPSGSPPSASDRPDGPVVDKGGVAQQLRKKHQTGASASRKVLTLKGTGLDDLASSGLDASLVKWAYGENNVTAGDGTEEFVGSYQDGTQTRLLGSTGIRHSVHGDVLHSRPVALNYGGGKVIVFYGSNDGFFRAVDGRQTGTTAGQELWSFVAPEHYGLLARLRDGTPVLHLPETNSSGGSNTAPAGSAVKSYGMDGPIGVFARYSTSGTATAAWIYPAMRRGGNVVYAFDVTDPTSPAYKWKITGGTGDFSRLAQTWSMPKPVVFGSTSTATAPLLIMGGGYDPLEDTNGGAASAGGSGRAVYLINGFSGARIAELPTENAVPSDVTVVDVDGDGNPDRAYVADVRGILYRIDFPKGKDPLASASWTGVQAVKIASLSPVGSVNKVFFPPDVVVTKSYVAVMVGTGDREKPLLATTSDRFALVKDTLGEPRGTPLQLSDLALIATVDNATMRPVPTSPTPNAANGCYVNLATNGEKVVNAPFTIAGATYFGTNRPRSNGNVCSADLGEAYAYKFPLFCVAPPPPSRLEGGGLPPSPVGGIVTMKVNGVDKQVPFLIGGGAGASPFRPEEPRPPIPPRRTRQYWHILNQNR